MITRVLVPIADGFEELEAVTLVDTLRRADLEVALVSIGGREVRGSRGVHVVADALWDEVEPASFDAVVLPGGLEGTLALAEHQGLLEALRACASRGAAVAALQPLCTANPEDGWLRFCLAVGCGCGKELISQRTDSG